MLFKIGYVCHVVLLRNESNEKSKKTRCLASVGMYVDCASSYSQYLTETKKLRPNKLPCAAQKCKQQEP